MSKKEFSRYARVVNRETLWYYHYRKLDGLLLVLRMYQNYANERLKVNGYLYLNEVYKILDLPSTEEGNCVGWIYDEENTIGDNFVDFGLGELISEGIIFGQPDSIVLDFNVDGDIRSKVEKIKRENEG